MLLDTYTECYHVVKESDLIQTFADTEEKTDVSILKPSPSAPITG